MSFRLYIARLKCLVKNKENMFWSYLFPIVMASCFFFAFNNLWSIESFETIRIAYDSKGEEADPLKEALEQARISEDTKMFSVTYCDSEEASKLLEDDEIQAYIAGSAEPELFVKKNGMYETIIKSFLDSYRRISAAVQSILEDNPEALNEGLMEDLMRSEPFVEELPDQKKPDGILIYFYALLAFTCIFAANWGLEEVINIQADQSTRGARVNVSPIHKMKLFLCNMAAAFTVHMVSIFILIAYMNYVLKINFGDRPGLILITCLAGSLTGIIMGATAGVLIKGKDTMKSAVLTSVIMAEAFLSGMMYADMKYIIATKAPLIGYINPVNLLADAFYSLYYYDTYDRFLLNIAGLCILTAVFGAISYLGLRRKTYASI